MSIDARVEEVIDIFISKLKENIGNNFTFYLTGSSVLDNYCSGWSDIDFLALTPTPFSEQTAEKILYLRQDMVREYNNNTFKTLEGAIMDIESFINNKNTTFVYWGTSGERIDTKYYFKSCDINILLDNGLLLNGKEIRNSLQRANYEDLIGDAIGEYNAIRKYGKINDNIKSYGWFLTTARAIYTVMTKKLTSKSSAATWVIDNDLFDNTSVLQLAINLRENALALHNTSFSNDEVIRNNNQLERFADILEKTLLDAGVEEALLHK